MIIKKNIFGKIDYIEIKTDEIHQVFFDPLLFQLLRKLLREFNIELPKKKKK